jgi:hypothetical protein
MRMTVEIEVGEIRNRVGRPPRRAVHRSKQLYSQDQLAKIPLSESSRWWRCAPHGYVDPDEQTTIYVSEHFGGPFTFTLRDGAFTYQPGKVDCRPPRGPFSASGSG